MSRRAREESARRVSDCVTALLQDQPFFGSLALRLPIRADAARETLASDGREIRYSPEWVADTGADLVKSAIGRVVLACALKHHTRRGERDPARWQTASQLVTHGLLRDAGFKLPPDAEAWDGISVEQAYDRLPEPQDDDGQDRGEDNPPSSPGGGNGGANDPQTGGDDDDCGDDTGPSGDSGPRDQDHTGEHDRTDAAPSVDPAGTGEIMDAGARNDGDADAHGMSTDAPIDVNAEEQAWDEAMHQALNLARAQGLAPGAVEETIRDAHRSTLDWRSLLRRYMTDAAPRDYSWSVPNRRFIDGGLFLPSMRTEGMGTLAVIIDTSPPVRPPHLDQERSTDRDLGDRAHHCGIAGRQPATQHLRLGPRGVDRLDRRVDRTMQRQVDAPFRNSRRWVQLGHRDSSGLSGAVPTSASSASRWSVQKRSWNSSQERASSSAAGLIRHTRSRPRDSRVTRPARSSTPRCFDTAANERSKGRERWLTVASPSARRSRMARRVESPSA